MKRHRAWIAALLLAGVALRLVLVLHAGEYSEDARLRYLEVARSLGSGQGIAIAGAPTAQVMPLWPLLLAARPSGLDPRWLALALSVLALGLAWRLALALRGPRAALVVLAALAIDPESARLGASALTEPLFGCLLLGFGLAWTARRTKGAALLLGLAVLTRPEAALVPLVIAAWTRSWRRPALLAAGVLIALAPWTVRNALAFGEFIPFTTTGGITLRAGLNPGDEGAGLRRMGQGRHWKFLDARELARRGIEASYDREQREQALRYARARPGRVLELLAAKLLQLWTPLQRKGTSALYAVATLLCWWAWLKRIRFRAPLVGPLLLLMTLVGAFFLSIPRYRVPYHPFVFLLAVAGVVSEKNGSGQPASPCSSA